VHAPSKDRSNGMKYSIYKELERVFDQFLMYNMQILLGDFSAKLGREDALKPTVRNENLREINNDNGVRVVNFTTSKNLSIKNIMFLHHNIHKFIWASPDGKTHNQIDYIFIDKRWHSSMVYVQSFREADCDTIIYLVAAKVRETVSK
jgi:hypothetical protein